jgi:hypothetical protein
MSSRANERPGPVAANTWGTPREAIAVITQRRHLRKTTVIALVIGTTFVTLNQLGTIVAGNADASVWLRVVVTYLTPLCVSNYSILIATRRQNA